MPDRRNIRKSDNPSGTSPDKIAAAIRDLRRELGLTQVQFAAELGITPTTVYRYESGGGTPTNDTLAKILQYAVGKQVPNAIQGLSDELSQRTGLNFLGAERLSSETPFVKAIANLRLEKRAQVMALVAMLTEGGNETEIRILEALLAPWMEKAKAPLGRH